MVPHVLRSRRKDTAERTMVSSDPPREQRLLPDHEYPLSAHSLKQNTREADTFCPVSRYERKAVQLFISFSSRYFNLLTRIADSVYSRFPKLKLCLSACLMVTGAIDPQRPRDDAYDSRSVC